jgi:hypothetical protein
MGQPLSVDGIGFGILSIDRSLADATDLANWWPWKPFGRTAVVVPHGRSTSILTSNRSGCSQRRQRINGNGIRKCRLLLFLWFKIVTRQVSFLFSIHHQEPYRFGSGLFQGGNGSTNFSDSMGSGYVFEGQLPAPPKAARYMIEESGRRAGSLTMTAPGLVIRLGLSSRIRDSCNAAC